MASVPNKTKALTDTNKRVSETKNDSLIHGWGSINANNFIGLQSQSVLSISVLSMCPPFTTAIPFLGFCPKKMHEEVHEDMGRKFFVLVRGKNRKSINIHQLGIGLINHGASIC